MDREQQVERVRKVIDAIAERALAVPAEARLALIKREIVKVRGDFLQTYEARFGSSDCLRPARFVRSSLG